MHDIPIDEVALAYCVAREIRARMAETDLFARKAGAPMPFKSVKIGEVAMLTNMIVALSIAAFPQLRDDEVAERLAAIAHASGRVQ